MKTFLVSLLICISLVSTAQNVEMLFEKKIEDSFIDNLLQSQRDYYLSESGDRIVFISDRSLVILDGNTGEMISKKEFIKKSNTQNQAITSGLSYGNSLRTDMEEGVAYHVDEADAKIIVLDYSLSKNLVMGFDLNSGEELWSVDKYRYTQSMDQQIFNAVTSSALALAPQLALGKVGPEQVSLQDVGQSLADNASESGFSSPSSEAWVKYMSGRNTFVLMANEGLICLDANNGSEKWKYTKGDLNPSFHGTVPGKNIWVALNFNASFLQKSKKVAMAFNYNTGEKISTMEFKSDYKENRAYIVGNNLVLDFISLEIFDIPSGKQLLTTIKPSTIKMGNMMSASNAGGKRNTETVYLRSIIDNGFAYNSVGRSGGRNYPNDGSWKSVITKYDISTGDEVWSSDKLPKGSVPLAKTDNHLVVRVDKGSGNYQIIALSDKDGSEVSESDKFDNYFEREGAGISFAGDMALLGAKKEVHLYDLASGEIKQTFDINKTGLGKMAGMGVGGDKLMLFGNKGMRVFNKDGSELNTIKTTRLNGGRWNEEVSLLFDDQKFFVVSNKDAKVIQELPHGPERGDQIFASSNLNHVVVLDFDRNLKVYSIK